MEDAKEPYDVLASLHGCDYFPDEPRLSVHYQLLAREDLDFVWWTADGLRGAPADFFDGYEGGWQEVLPNGGPPAEHRGARFDQHGDVAGLAWDYAIVEDSEDIVSVRFSVRSRRVPLRVVKTMSLRSGAAALEVAEEVTNESPVPESGTRWLRSRALIRLATAAIPPIRRDT